MPSSSDWAYARKQLRYARNRHQIAGFEELDRGAFVVHFIEPAHEWVMTTSMAIAFAKGLRIGFAAQLDDTATR